MEKYTPRQASPAISSSAFSSIYTWWITHRALKVRKCGLNLEDLPEPPTDMKADVASQRLNKIRNTGISEDATVWEMQLYYMKLAICSSPWHILTILITSIIVLISDIGNLILVDRLLQAKLRQEESLSTFAGLICIAAMLKAMLFYCNSFVSERVGSKLKLAFTSLIISKMLLLTEYEVSSISPAHITNLASTDVDIVMVGGYFMFSALYIPMCAIASILTCWHLLGWVCVIAIGLMIVQLIVQVILMKKYANMRKTASEYSDKRMTITSDVLKGMKAVKMNAWEQAFQNTINTIRKSEINIIRQSNFIRSINSAIFAILPKLSTFLVIVAYINIYNEFPITQILPFNGITIIFAQAMCFLLPMFLSTNIDAHVALQRIEKFLKTTSTPRCASDEISENDITLDLQRVCCSWNKDNCILNNITFSAGRNNLIGIVGKVGSGKSTLLKAILGEIPIKSGKINVQGSIAYAPQEPWVFSATIEQNIIFGQDYDKTKLQQALDISSLSEDIKSFPNGVQQLVGERGIMLSGGQKARLNLARAIYADADIYLLDDPFSAVDVNIGVQIYKKCITEFMSRKICILVTHQVHLLQNTTMTITISEGNAYSENVIYDRKLCNSDHNSNHQIDNTTLQLSSDTFDKTNVVKYKENKQQEMKMEKDFHKKGGTSFKLYWQYFAKHNGIIVLMAFGTMLLIFNGLLCGLLVWLGIWINAEAVELQARLTVANVTTNVTFNNNFDRSYYFVTFSALTFGVVAAALCVMAIFTQIFYQSSFNIHKNLLKSVFSAKMEIFETHPIGVFVNRFSMDLKKVDTDIPRCMIFFIPEFCNSLSYIIITVIGNYWLALPFVILGTLQMLTFKTVFRILREAMRVDGTARSALYTKLVNSISGLAVVKAFRKEHVIQAELEHTINTCTSASFLKNAFYLWGSQIVQIMTAAYVIACVILMVLSTDTNIGGIAISLVSSFALVETFFWANIQFGCIDCEMPALERIAHYTKLPGEANLRSASKIPNKGWPSKGEIVCKNISLKYSDNGINILQGLNFRTKPMEKIGIIGRTGAGKSSIFDAIYHLHMPTGNIIIDGVNTEEIALHDLRSNLSIIPQDPTFFFGTIRTNIDPLNMYTDNDIWTAIEQVQMKDAIEKLGKGLDFQVAEGGLNFSVGEKQLICLARAILRNSKILMLDEATANVDNKTDTIIQAAIRSHFKNCTVLTIAHRLNTVLDSDRILVIDNGSIIDFDKPANLLNNKDSALQKFISK